MIAAAFTIHNQGGSTWESAKTLFENLKKHDLYERFARVFESSDITEDDKIKELTIIIRSNDEIKNSFILVSEEARKPSASTVHIPIILVESIPGQPIEL